MGCITAAQWYTRFGNKPVYYSHYWQIVDSEAGTGWFIVYRGPVGTDRCTSYITTAGTHSVGMDSDIRDYFEDETNPPQAPPPKKSCACDFYMIVLPYGCQCGGL